MQDELETLRDTCRTFCYVRIDRNVYKLVTNLNIEVHYRQGRSNFCCFVSSHAPYWIQLNSHNRIYIAGHDRGMALRLSPWSIVL
jgi:hypothetical protein